ncbi:D-alanyl-D-alanine carboxypeptidase family protein [Limoniibacter endophyticus]|uniref:serine-type D-Ala-D-Ala carboxypeptidase n=1 Tax=Limoniibacter endophyticus TaxID=1565040 RepID=A0A8J3GFV4_9HYPH|nr:D-alanyl-D-alanine carboxypeptidase family protein [Limoniibacter endophyticus]GHC61020.1 D-alanyl-D-alanine carboxypeptidase [Limoniibacter endophyticus]
MRAAFIKRIIVSLFFIGVAGLAMAQDADESVSFGIQTRAPQAFLVDAETGTVLFSKNADQKVAPASLAKLMTAELVFKALHDGDLRMDQAFQITEDAWRRGGAPSRGSTMFAALKSNVAVSDLLQGLIVQSANDSAIVLGAGIAGSESAFATKMNERAAELGLSNSHFTNATGLPDPAQHVSMRDMTRLAQHIWRSYPQYYHYFSQEAFEWNRIFQRNRNPLLSLGIGADGLQTGNTEEAGFALVASATRDGRRLFAAMSGMADNKERGDEARKLIDWGFSNFERVHLFDEGEVIGTAVSFGANGKPVELRTDRVIDVLLPIAERDQIAVEVVYQGPIAAPVAADTRLGTLQVKRADEILYAAPVFAKTSVEAASLYSRASNALWELAFGWLRRWQRL